MADKEREEKPAKAPRRKAQARTAPLLRILLGLLGALLMAWGIGIPLLGLLGEEVPATITLIRKQGMERNESVAGRYTHVVNYRFVLPDGRAVEGFTYMIGGYTTLPGLQGPKPFTVRYLPAFPRLNTPSIQASPNLEHLIVVAVGWFVGFGLWRSPRKRGHGRRSVQLSGMDGPQRRPPK